MNLLRKITAALIVATALAAPSEALAQEPFKRGLEYVSFIPKGQWITGVSVNYSQSDQDNYQFLVIENINGDTYSFKVSPTLMYCFKDNLAAGGKFSYTRSRARLNSASLILDSETSYDVDHLYAITSNYYGTAVFRNYFSLGSGMRFGMFNEVQLELGGGQSKLTNGAGEDFTGTFERNFSMNIGLTPGMVMFLNIYSAIEVNIGVLGFGYTDTKSTTDRIYVAHRKSRHANFKINLFSVSFGCVFYL